jgi:hypothetical protein
MIDYPILTENSGKWYSVLNQSLDIALKLVAPHLCIREFPGSNLGPKTDYPD